MRTLNTQTTITEEFSPVTTPKLQDALHGHSVMADNMGAMVREIIAEKLPELKVKTPHVDWEAVFGLVQEGNNIVQTDGMEAFQKHFLKEDGTLDASKTAAYMELQNVVMVVDTYSPVLVEREFETDTQSAQKALKERIKRMKQAGYSLADVMQSLKDIKISKSFTDHPTEHLNKQGIEFSRQLAATGELPPAEREKARRDIIRQMVMNPIGATSKDSIQDEIEAANKWARIHNEGCCDLERFIGDCIEEEYGKRPVVVLDISPRSWGYDTDGKNNAEGWARMAKMASTTLGAFEDTLEALSKVPEGVHPRILKRTVKRIADVKARLEPIYMRAREITMALAELPPEERQAYYEAHYAEFEKLSGKAEALERLTGTYQETEESKKTFAHIYDDSDKEKRGRITHEKTLADLDVLRKALKKSEDASFIGVDNVFRTLRRTGFALEKGQKRHSDLVNSKIDDNLFNSDDFWNAGFDAEEFKAIREDVRKAGGVTNLPFDYQKRIFEKVSAFAKQQYDAQKEDGKPKNFISLVQVLFDANPLEFDPKGNGFPIQTRTLLDCLFLESLYPLKFNQGIISDSGPGAILHQKVLADIMGMDKMQHMPLFEDRENLGLLSTLVKGFNDVVGGIINARRKSSKENGWVDSYFSGRDIHDLSVIVPCSDSTRGSGSGAIVEILHELRKVPHKLFELCEELNDENFEKLSRSIEIMLGGAMDFGRLGAYVAIICRALAQELKEISIERGRPFDRHDKIERRMMRMCKALLYTEQGRAKRYYTATSRQVTDDFARKIVEMIDFQFDLEGLVPDNTYIPKPFKYTNPVMEDVVLEARKAAQDSYEQHRFLRSSRGGYVLDHLAEYITCPNVMAYLNYASRPLSKGKDVTMTSERAIGNTHRNNGAEIFTSGFGTGDMMLYLEKQIENRRITEDDVREMMDDPTFEYLLFTKETANALRRDFTYALEKVKGANIPIEELKKIAANVKIVELSETDKNGKNKTFYQMDMSNVDLDITEEQIYLAKMILDHERYIQSVERFVDIKKQFPTAVEIAKEHQKSRPGIAVIHLLQDQLDLLPPEERLAKIDEWGAATGQSGDSFMRSIGSTFRSGTLAHKAYWANEKTYYAPKDPGIPFEKLLVLGKKQNKVIGRNMPKQNFKAKEYEHN